MTTFIRKIAEMIRGKRGKAEHLATGEAGEEAAAGYLKKAGFKILGRRVKYKGRYELDIVASEGEVLVFVEVKTRKGEMFGRPIDSIKRGKIRALTKAAWEYIKRLKNKDIYYRFDVVEVVGDDPSEYEIRHFRDAFKPARMFYF